VRRRREPQPAAATARDAHAAHVLYAAAAVGLGVERRGAGTVDGV
jgi:hypothetical protein